MIYINLKMRIFDFIIFYAMANFQRRNTRNETLESQLSYACFGASLPFSLFICLIGEVISFSIFHVEILEGSYLPVLIAIWVVLDSRLFVYVYKTKKRFEYICDIQNRRFNANINWGISISLLLIVSSFAVFVVGSVLIEKLFSK